MIQARALLTDRRMSDRALPAELRNGSERVHFERKGLSHTLLERDANAQLTAPRGRAARDTQRAPMTTTDRITAQRKALLVVLLLNVVLVVGLSIGGLAADSSGLIANALDNLSDVAAYALTLFAIARSARWKAGAATISGVLLLLFAIGVVVDTARRFASGSEPIGAVMMGMAVVATVINVACVRLLRRWRHADVNLRAAETYSVNDFAANTGVLVAGVLVALTGARWPDLVVGLAVAAIAAYGGIKILRDARRGDDGDRDPRAHIP